MSPKIDDHDIDTKVRSAAKFLDEGDKLKITVRFRGRELAHPDRGRTLLMAIADKLKDHGTIERQPLLEGRQMFMVMNPARQQAQQPAAPAPAAAPRPATAAAPVKTAAPAPAKTTAPAAPAPAPAPAAARPAPSPAAPAPRTAAPRPAAPATRAASATTRTTKPTS